MKGTPRLKRAGERYGVPHTFREDTFSNTRWYISAGLNPTFDIFDCQVHFFSIPSPMPAPTKLPREPPFASRAFKLRIASETESNSPSFLRALRVHESRERERERDS